MHIIKNYYYDEFMAHKTTCVSTFNNMSYFCFNFQKKNCVDYYEILMLPGKKNR